MSNTDNTLPEELQNKIETVAEAAANVFEDRIAKIRIDGHIGLSTVVDAYEEGYIAGATEYAPYKVRCEKALNHIIKMQHAGTVELRNEIINEIKSFLDGTQ